VPIRGRAAGLVGNTSRPPAGQRLSFARWSRPANGRICPRGLPLSGGTGAFCTVFVRIYARLTSLPKDDTEQAEVSAVDLAYAIAQVDPVKRHACRGSGDGAPQRYGIGRTMTRMVPATNTVRSSSHASGRLISPACRQEYSASPVPTGESPRQRPLTTPGPRRQ
jgi:hypothetical protein